MENEKKSFVKFGGYDPEGFEDANDIKLMTTIKDDSWAV